VKSILIIARPAHTAGMHAEFHRTDGSGGYAVIIRRDDGLTVRLPGYDRKWRVPHDLAHFVAEREFRLNKGVFGSIAAGAMFTNMTVVDGRQRFDAKVRSRAVLRAHTAEIGIAELVAGVVHQGVERGERYEEVWVRLRGAWGTVRSGPCPYHPETLRRVLAILAALAERWQALPAGEWLTLRWPLPVEISAGDRGAAAPARTGRPALARRTGRTLRSR
jgi:hypothetical protein